MTARRYGTWTLYRRVLREAAPFRWHIAAMLVVSLLSTPLALLAPVPLAVAVDSVIGDRPLPAPAAALVPDAIERSDGALLALVAALLVAIALATQLQGLVSGVLRTWVGQRLVLAFRAQLFRHAQRLSVAYHDARGTSDALYRIHHDASAMKGIAIEGVIPFVSSTVALVAMIAVTAAIHLELALVALAVTPVLFVATYIYGARLRGGWHGLNRLDSSIMGGVQETLGGMRVVQAFGQEEREQARFERRAGERVQARTRLAVTEHAFGVAVGLVMAGGTATVLFLGVRDVQAGTLSLGSLLVVMSYLGRLYQPLEKISQKLGELQSALVSAERAFRLLDREPEVRERPHARRLRRGAGAIAVEAVTFRYDGGPPVLEDMSFELPAGGRLGISGPTGAGKTTLAGLLPRFFDPVAGRVRLDGVDVREYRLADLRRQFAIVLQEPLLFSASVGENIAYARPEAGAADVVAAARAAHAHAFISALPEGYATRVGERGMRLSGGERQRISLARAFLRDAPVLILDEPTSAVDTRTEELIIAGLEQLVDGRTAIVIAHRLSTLGLCDARLELTGR